VETTTRPDSNDRELSQWLGEAVGLHRAGKLDDAARTYKAILGAHPRSFDALHLLGVVRLQQGRLAEGCDSIRSALDVSPNNVGALSNLANALRQLNRRDEALATFDRALAIQPDYPEAHNNRGIVLKDLGRDADALASFDQALALRPDYAEALNNRGNVLKGLDRPQEALASFDRALAIRPRYPEALNNRGSVLMALGRVEEALASFDKALALRPDYPDALNNRGNALKQLGKPEAALASFDRALALRPDYPEALNNRGNVLTDLLRPGEALASYDKALAITPDFADALNSRGTALISLGRLDDARTSFDRALAIRPGFADAHYNRGLASLLAGDLSGGWADYEYRWDRTGADRRRLTAAYPAWKGEDLRGKSIVVYEEQGLGDVIQFCRFLPRLAAMGANVTLLVRPSMHRLLRSLAPSVGLIGKPSEANGFDFQCALLSLPAALGTRLDSIPAEVPYLFAEEARAARWRGRLQGPGFKIGICWQGTPGITVDIGRSIPLRCFEAIASVDGVRLISLQKNHGLDQLAGLPPGMKVETLGAEFDSGPDAFVDTAAVLSNLDLIITSDTSVAHLAGAMGAPTWVALRSSPDWRWLLDRPDSPWYPTMRLFRQDTFGDWSGVFSRMAQELRSLIAQSRI